MISIVVAMPGTKCNGCGRVDDIYSVQIGKDKGSIQSSTYLCPECRKQLSKMLTKRVK